MEIPKASDRKEYTKIAISLKSLEDYIVEMIKLGYKYYSSYNFFDSTSKSITRYKFVKDNLLTDFSMEEIIRMCASGNS